MYDTVELKTQRLIKGLGISKLSQLAEVCEATLRRLESGSTKNPQPATIRRIAQALGVEMSVLVTRDTRQSKDL